VSSLLSVLDTPIVNNVIPFRKKQDFIETYQDDLLASDCEKVIEQAENESWYESKTIVADNGEKIEGMIEKEKRDSFQQDYSTMQMVPEHQPLLFFTGHCLQHYLKKFPFADKFPAFSVTEKYNILKYEKDQAYHTTHSDYFPNGYASRRHLTGVFFLSNVSEGGELVFPQQNLEIKPERGKLVIFPTGWTHAHHTMPVLSDEVRYVFQLWWSFE
tara:strand:+ start:5431 stop:6075 length:645 start_codon:yes stop_codon:yes gene_type:complete